MKFFSFFRQHLAAIFGLGALFLMGCMGEEESAPQPKFSSLYESYFKDCATCHAAGKEAFRDVELDMAGGRDAAYAALTSASIVYNSKPECSGRGIRIVSPTGYDASLLKSLIGTTSERSAFAAANNGCTPTQHIIYNAVPGDATRAAIQKWIAAGAENN